MIPGEIITPDSDIEMNVGRETLKMRVANAGDRPDSIGSHFHFAEANDALQFDRERARGYRLEHCCRYRGSFEPGRSRDIELVALAGKREVYGFAGRVMGKLD